MINTFNIINVSPVCSPQLTPTRSLSAIFLRSGYPMTLITLYLAYQLVSHDLTNKYENNAPKRLL